MDAGNSSGVLSSADYAEWQECTDRFPFQGSADLAPIAALYHFLAHEEQQQDQQQREHISPGRDDDDDGAGAAARLENENEVEAPRALVFGTLHCLTANRWERLVCDAPLQLAAFHGVTRLVLAGLRLAALRPPDEVYLGDGERFAPPPARPAPPLPVDDDDAAESEARAQVEAAAAEPEPAAAEEGVVTDAMLRCRKLTDRCAWPLLRGPTSRVTPMMAAARGGRLELLEALVRRNPDGLTDVDGAGRGVFHHAASCVDADPARATRVLRSVLRLIPARRLREELGLQLPPPAGAPRSQAAEVDDKGETLEDFNDTLLRIIPSSQDSHPSSTSGAVFAPTRNARPQDARVVPACVTGNEVTPLRAAGIAGAEHCVALLLSLGKKHTHHLHRCPMIVGMSTTLRETALHGAAQSGNLPSTRAIFATYADKREAANALTARKETVMHCAVRSGSIELIKWVASAMYDDKWSAIPQTHDFGGCLVMAAARSGSPEAYEYVVRRLDEYGALDMTPTKDGWTVFHSAAMSGSARMVTRVLSRGAVVDGVPGSKSATSVAESVRAVDKEGYTVLHAAITSNDELFVAWLAQQLPEEVKAKRHVIFGPTYVIPLFYGNVSMIAQLVELNLVDVNAVGPFTDGYPSMLLYAARFSRSPEMVLAVQRFLGVDPRVTVDRQGRNIKYYAQRNTGDVHGEVKSMCNMLTSDAFRMDS